MHNNASNFAQSTLADSASGSPYAGAFTRVGQEWISPGATDGTYLVFQAASGNLIVVLEPSTIVFAGLDRLTDLVPPPRKHRHRLPP